MCGVINIEKIGITHTIHMSTDPILSPPVFLWVEFSVIGTRVLSDHAPVKMHMTDTPPQIWKMNEIAFQDLIMQKNIREVVTNYFTENMPEELT